MDVGEQHRVVSASARPSSWLLVERPWLRATKGVHAATAFNADAGRAAYATKPVVKLSAHHPRAAAGRRVTSNGAAGTAPMRYP